MKQPGINVNIYGYHSTRSASTPKCKVSRLSTKEIARSAGWSNKPMIDHFKRIIDLMLLYIYGVMVFMALFMPETKLIKLIMLIRLKTILDYYFFTGSFIPI